MGRSVRGSVVAALVAVVMTACVLPGATRAASGPPPASAAASLATGVCALATVAPEDAAPRLIRAMKRRHVAVLSTEVSGTLNEFWCAADLYLLQPVLRQVVTTKPSFAKRLGPWAFDLHVTTLAPGADADQVRAEWGEFNVRGTARTTLYRRIGTDRWSRVTSPDATVPHGSFVQYAVRVRDSKGQSPWNYSRQYTF